MDSPVSNGINLLVSVTAFPVMTYKDPLSSLKLQDGGAVEGCFFVVLLGSWLGFYSDFYQLAAFLKAYL